MPPDHRGHSVHLWIDFADLSTVRLGRDVECPEGRLPKGSAGTVVARYDGGLGYEVEFNEPFHTVATVAGHDLEQ